MKFQQFHGMGSKFVYYNDLERTHNDIFKALQASGITYMNTRNSRLDKISLHLSAWASNEAAKEVKMLSQYFNVKINFSEGQLYSSSIGKEIIVAVNTCLQFKDAFKRHLTRIGGPEGKKGTAKITSAQFFNSYFQEEFFKIVKDTLVKAGDGIMDLTVEQLGEYLFSEQNINQALYNTFFIRLKNSGDWTKNDEARGYKELFSQIEKFNKNEFLQQVYKAYHLDEFKNRLLSNLKENEQLNEIFSDKKGAKKYIKTSLSESTTAKGTLSEIVGEYGAKAAVSAIQGSGVQVNFDSRGTGHAGGKADFVLTFGVDSSRIFDVIDKSYRGREKTVSAYKTLNEYLSNIDNGFIVYTNAKDYSLIKQKSNGGYFFQGFSSGSDIDLRTLEGVISNTPGGSQDLIGQIMNTMEGAVYEGLKDEVAESLCEKMAYFLFDDVLTIGKPTEASGHAIHLLYLDGVYIPLSYMFFLMSDAVSSVSNGSYLPEDIFKVTIDSGKIAFPEGPWAPGDWIRQKEIAYSQIKIGATFLKSFVDIISDLRK